MDNINNNSGSQNTVEWFFQSWDEYVNSQLFAQRSFFKNEDIIKKIFGKIEGVDYQETLIT